MFLGVNRLLEDRFTPRGFGVENPMRVAQLRLIGALGLVMRHNTAEVQIDDEHRLTARTDHFKL